MALIDQLESKLGRHAIPGVVAMLGGLQGLVWLLLAFQPHMLESLLLVPPLVRQGEVWRLVSWVFVPSTPSAIWMVVTVYFMFMLSDALDRAWGAFRVNLYVFSSIFLVAAGTMVFDPEGASLATGMYLYWTLFLAFAVFYPDFEILLFMILPLKAKYLALITAGKIVLDFIDRPEMRLSIFLALTNFIIAFGPMFVRNLRQRGRVAVRRTQFEAAKAPEEPHLHRCRACGKTEQDDPSLDFRVGEDGEDYCNRCRAQREANG